MALARGEHVVAPGRGERIEGTHTLLGLRPGSGLYAFHCISPGLQQRGISFSAEKVATR